MAKIKNLKNAIAAGAIGLASLASNAQAQDNKGIEGRIILDYSGNSNDQHTIRSTLGLATEGAYKDLPVSVYGQFFENFRVEDVWQDSGDGSDWFHYTAAGLRVPELKFGELSNNAIVFGSFGDVEGFGVENVLCYGPASLTLNAEHRFDNDDTRLGIGLDVKLGDNFKLGAGYDRVNTSQGSLDQYLVNGIWDVTKTDTLGAALVKRDETDNSTTYSADGFWTRYGADEKWGVRALARYDWNDDQKLNSFGGEIIFAENPTTFKPGATWIVGRNATSDDMYNPSIIPLSLSRTEPVFLADRAFSGFSARLAGNHTEIDGLNSSSLEAGVGYMFPNEVAGGRFGASVNTRYQFNDGSENSFSVSPAVIYRKGNFEVNGGVSIPVTGDSKPAGFIGLQLKF